MKADGTESFGEAMDALNWRLIWAIMTQFIIAGLLGLVIHIVTTLDGFAYIIGAFIWGIILFFTPAVKMWFIKPLGNHAVVLEHALKRKEPVSLEQATRMQKTKAFRVIYGPRLTGKSMFEGVLNNQIIDLRRSIGLDEKDIKVSTGDGANHTLKFWTAGTPIPIDEPLINLARHTESAVIEYFRRSFIGYLQRATNQIPTTDDLLTAMSVDGQGNPTGHLIKGFNELFSGKDAVHPEELERGMFTGDPKCEVTIDPKFQKVRQARPTAQLKKDAIDILTGGPKGVNPDVAANMVAADVGDELPGRVNKFIIDVPAGSGTRDIIVALDGRTGGNRP